MSCLKTKTDIKNYYNRIRKENFNINNDILYFLECNNMKQFDIIDNFDISNINICKYNLNFKVVEFINSITSTLFKNRVGRKLYFLVKYNDIIIGLFSYASPVLNNKLNNYLKDKFSDFNYKIMNDKVVELSVCIGIGLLTKYLIGKLICLISISREMINIFNAKYNTDIEYLVTTSLYGKSSMYNRLRDLKYLGLTEGLTSIITKEFYNEILEKYKETFPNRKMKITSQSIHIIRLYDQLLRNNVKLSKEIPKISKGVYICNNFRQIEDNIKYWYNRWFIPRRNRMMAEVIHD